MLLVIIGVITGTLTWIYTHKLNEGLVLGSSAIICGLLVLTVFSVIS